MGKENLPDSFYEERADLFEVLSNPARIRILQILNEQPMQLPELKQKLGIEGDDQLASHLDKMWELVRMTDDGRYALGNEGREALKIALAKKAKPKQKKGATLEHV